jgi:hypothetical protein
VITLRRTGVFENSVAFVMPEFWARVLIGLTVQAARDSTDPRDLRDLEALSDAMASQLTSQPAVREFIQNISTPKAPEPKSDERIH